MIGRASNFLGLAFSDRGIICAEIGVNGDRRTLRHVANFLFTPELSLEKPETAGTALAAFLREKRFGTTRAVAGVPARWVIAAEKDIPPANEHQARAALQLQAERMGGGEGNEIVFDYVGQPDTSAPSRMLLVGIARQQFERVRRLLDSAGLSVAAITSTGLAFFSTQSGERDGALLLLGAGGAEMVIRDKQNARALRHISYSLNGNGLPAVGLLGAELRRAVTIHNGAAAADDMLLLDGLGLEAAQIDELSQRSGIRVVAGQEMKLLGLSSDAVASARSAADASQPAGSYAPAISLAMTAAEPDDLPLNFIKSRLSVVKTRRIGRNAILAMIAGVALIAYIITQYVQVHRSESDLGFINARINNMEQASTEAQTLVQRVNYAREYYDQRPPALDCLRQLTLTFHDNDSIWVTSFNYHENGKCVIQGKAANRDNELGRDTVLGIVDRLKKNPKFTIIEHLDIHEADARTHEWQFSFNFTYNPTG